MNAARKRSSRLPNWRRLFSGATLHTYASGWSLTEGDAAAASDRVARPSAGVVRPRGASCGGLRIRRRVIVNVKQLAREGGLAPSPWMVLTEATNPADNLLVEIVGWCIARYSVRSE
jgi:hypothetical protein